MAKPLRSEDPTPPKSMQFAHFGVLNDGQQSKASLFTSISLNIIIALVVIIIGAAAKKTMDHRQKLTSLVEPIPIKKEPEPIKPKVLPKPLPPTPKIKVEPPKINIPQVKLPDIPKPPELKMAQPAPVVLPAPPKLVTPPPAPKVVSLAQAQPTSVMANTHPAPVALGQANNPIAPSNRPATSAINLGNRGVAGMPASNTGMGATKVALGSGSPNSTNMAGNGNHAVQGIKLGVAGGTGPLNATGKVAGPVNLGQNQPPPMPKPQGPSTNDLPRSAPRSSSSRVHSTLKRPSSCISRAPSPSVSVSLPREVFRCSASPAASAMDSMNPHALPSWQPASSPPPTRPVHRSIGKVSST